MSKRFGRNQKRRMREDVARLQYAIDSDRRIMDYQSMHLLAAEEHMRNVAELVGDCAIAAGEPTMMGGRPMEDGFRMPVYKPFGICDALSQASPMDTIKCETMRLLRIETVRYYASQQIHCMVALANGRVGYAISESALYCIGVDKIKRVIAPQIALQLAIDLKGKK